MNSCAGSVSGKEEVADMGACCPHTPARRKRTAGRPVVYLLGAKPPERRRTRRSRRILLWFRRRVELREFIDHWARSFDCGEYAFAQDAPCGRFGIEEFSIGIPVLATSRKSWQENKISRDILEEAESELEITSRCLVTIGAHDMRSANPQRLNSSLVFLRALRVFVVQ